MTDDRARQARKAAERPELRIISRAGEELTADALTITNYQHWSCNDYVLVEVSSDDQQPLNVDKERCYVIMSPKDLVLVKPRDRRDHIMWLVERRRYEEALEEVERVEAEGSGNPKEEDELIAQDIRRKYFHHLINEGYSFLLLIEPIVLSHSFTLGDFIKAAKVCSKFCGRDSKLWEAWIFIFEEKKQLQVRSLFFFFFHAIPLNVTYQAIIPYVPIESPRLDHLVYEVILAHFLIHDRQVSL